MWIYLLPDKVEAAGTNFREAEYLSIGETKEDAICISDNYTGFYTFNLNERTTLDIKTVCEIGALELLVYNSDGDEVYKDHTSEMNILGMVTDHFYLTLNEGRYYLVLDKSWRGSSEDRLLYSLTLNRLNSSVLYNYGGQTIEKPSEIGINSNWKSIIYGNYVSKYCVEYYKISIPRKTDILVEASTENGCIIKLKWYDSEKKMIDEHEFNGANSCKYLITLPAGEYYFSVDNSGNNGNHCFWYEAKLAEAKLPKLNTVIASVKRGRTFTLKVANIYEQTVSWKSSNKKVATVSELGLVKGIKKGTAVITATVRGKKLKCKVVVK